MPPIGLGDPTHRGVPVGTVTTISASPAASRGRRRERSRLRRSVSDRHCFPLSTINTLPSSQLRAHFFPSQILKKSLSSQLSKITDTRSSTNSLEPLVPSSVRGRRPPLARRSGSRSIFGARAAPSRRRCSTAPSQSTRLLRSPAPRSTPSPRPNPPPAKAPLRPWEPATAVSFGPGQLRAEATALPLPCLRAFPTLPRPATTRSLEVPRSSPRTAALVTTSFVRPRALA